MHCVPVNNECLSQVLDVSSNLLTSIPEDTLSRLPCLRSLGLSFCLLETLPADLGCCSSLISLEVQDNCLEHLPSSICNLHSLRILDLGQNKLRSLPDGMECLENLHELLLNNNKLCRLDINSILGLSKLTYLDLSFNQLEQLPDRLDCLTSLNVLLLSNNSLRTLPQSFAFLSSLTLLKLSDNQLSFLPQHFGSNLLRLTDLALDSNKLTSLPESLAEAENLEYLDLHSNMISKLPAVLGQLSKLAILNLRNNFLVSLPSELGQLLSLRVLDLSDNQLCSLPTSIATLKLSALWLASNQARPLVPFTVVWGEEGPQLTCFLLPQINTIEGVVKPDMVRSFSRQVSFCCKESEAGAERVGKEKFTARSAEVLPQVKTRPCRPRLHSLVKMEDSDHSFEKSDVFQDHPINSATPHSPIMKMVQSRVARMFRSHNYKDLSSSTDSM